MTMRLGLRRCPGRVLAVTTVLAVGAATFSGAGAAAAVATTLAAASTPAAASLCTSAAHPRLAAGISRGILSAMRGRSSVVGIEADDPAVQVSCRYHPWWNFHSASVVKVIILGALLRELQARHQPLTAGQVTLARAMITESDNNAATALWDEVGRTGLQRFLGAARMIHTQLGPDDYWGVTEVDAHDEMVLLRLLVTQNQVLDRSSRAYALKLMAEVIPSQRWGVPAGAPSNVTVHVKNGWLPDPTLWDINSIGDFTHHGGAYSIAILTRDNPTMGYGVGTIERIASPINQELDAYVRWAARHSP
jgi:beta-lactamase class A